MDQYPRIKNEFLYLNQNPSILHNKNKPTCVFTLINLGKQDILELCEFALQTDAISSNILLIDQGVLVLQLIPLSILKLFCSQVFKSGIFTYHASYTGCRDETIVESTQFAINIPFLERLMNTSQI